MAILLGPYGWPVQYEEPPPKPVVSTAQKIKENIQIAEEAEVAEQALPPVTQPIPVGTSPQPQLIYDPVTDSYIDPSEPTQPPSTQHHRHQSPNTGFYEEYKYYVWGGTALVSLGAIYLLSRRSR